MATKAIPLQGAANPVRHETNQSRSVAVRHEAKQHVCDRGLEIKIQMSDLEFEYNELKPQIEAYCEANGGVYNSPLGSYSTRFTPKYEYPSDIELKRIELKQAEERAKLDGSAELVNTLVSVAANILKRTRTKKLEPIAMPRPDDRFEPEPEDIVIPAVDESAPIPEGATCQEASNLSRNRYIPCGQPATAMVRHDNDRRSYLMCAPCADHNVRNRGGILLKTTTQSEGGATPGRRKTKTDPTDWGVR